MAAFDDPSLFLLNETDPPLIVIVFKNGRPLVDAAIADSRFE